MGKTEDRISEILEQHREWMRGIRTDHLVGTSDKETKSLIMELCLETKVEGRKIQAEATLDKWHLLLNNRDFTTFLYAQVEAHRYELEQLSKEIE